MPIPSFMALEAFKFYALCSALLALNMVVLSSMTGAIRSRTKSFSNPEDAKKDSATSAANAAGATSATSAANAAGAASDHPDVLRVTRAHRNAVENIPIFFAIGLIYTLSGASALGAKVYFITFTVVRILHSIFHMKALQPFRSISYFIGNLCLVGMIVQIVMAAF